MTSSFAKPPSTWALALAFGIIYVAWGTTYYAIKLGVQQEKLPPLMFGGVRLCVAAVILLGWQAVCGQSLRVSVRDLARMTGVGLFLFVAGNGFITVGQRYVDSSLAAVLIATTPLWIGMFAMLWPQGERLTGRGWCGMLVGMAGVALLLEPQWNQSTSQVDNLGVIYVLASAAAWALGALLLRQIRPNLHHLTSSGYQMLTGGISLLVAGAALGELAEWPSHITNEAVGIFLYLLLVGSLAGFVAFSWLLRHVSAAKVGTYAYVNPPVAVLIGWFFGEEVTGRLWLGIGIILAGVFLVRGGERPAATHTRAQDANAPATGNDVAAAPVLDA